MYGPAARWGSANVLFLGASAQLPQRHDRWLGEPETVGLDTVFVLLTAGEPNGRPLSRFTFSASKTIGTNDHEQNLSSFHDSFKRHPWHRGIQT